MKRYTFLMLAFFLLFFVQAMAVTSTEKELKELGNIKESEEKVEQPKYSVPLGSFSSRPYKKVGRKPQDLSVTNCRTYDGDLNGTDEARYNDCVRRIKTDRKGTRVAE